MDADTRCLAHTRADIERVNYQFPHLKPPTAPPGNCSFLSHSSRCDFVLFLRSRFANSFVKPHKGLQKRPETQLRKTVARKLSSLNTEQDYRNSISSRLSYSTAAVPTPIAANPSHNGIQTSQLRGVIGSSALIKCAGNKSATKSVIGERSSGGFTPAGRVTRVL